MNYKTLSAIKPAELLPPVIKISKRAGNAIINVYNTDFSVAEKEDSSPLTLADSKSHEIISRELRELTPALPVLSEESTGTPYEKRRDWGTYWLVDPLDGTREFIKRNGEFTVNIAMIDKHMPVLGVVYLPVTGDCYYASKGGAAFKLPAGGIPQPIHTRATGSGRFTAAGSRSHSNEKTKAFFQALGKNTEIISSGSSLKFCLVAEGKVDIYPRFGPTCEWDTAAAQCIVEEAGGKVTDTDMNPLRYNTGESLINPDFLVIADPSFDWKPYIDSLQDQ